jgi:hypothetical protein
VGLAERFFLTQRFCAQRTSAAVHSLSFASPVLKNPSMGTNDVQEPADRYLSETPSYLVVEAGVINGVEVADIFRSFAARCLQKQINRVLLKTADHDPAGERALRDAFTTILLAGIPSDFKIALLAPTQLIQATYRNAQRDLAMAGVDAKLFDSEAEAVCWLDGPDRGTRAATG